MSTFLLDLCVLQQPNIQPFMGFRILLGYISIYPESEDIMSGIAKLTLFGNIHCVFLFSDLTYKALHFQRVTVLVGC